MTPKNNSSQTDGPRTTLFPLTKAEEAAVGRAMVKAKIFMMGYGKGREPFMLNRENYICNDEQPGETDKED